MSHFEQEEGPLQEMHLGGTTDMIKDRAHRLITNIFELENDRLRQALKPTCGPLKPIPQAN